MGIEPTSKAWEALILPMNYAREGDALQISKIHLENALIVSLHLATVKKIFSAAVFDVA